jgi:RNA polymerase sigma-70 factor (ECF subfamily)
MPSPRFDDTILPHLNAAYNFARWLTRNDAEAEDVVQDACIRAMRFFDSFRGGDARSWLMAIVRNTWYSRAGRRAPVTELNPMSRPAHEPVDEALDPEALLLQQHAVARVRDGLEQLPVDFREVIVLREIEGLSYKEIAAVINAPIGTVMSRLARARERLLAALQHASGAPVENAR